MADINETDHNLTNSPIMSDSGVHSTPVCTISNKLSDEILKLLRMLLKEQSDMILEKPNIVAERIISCIKGEIKQQSAKSEQVISSCLLYTSRCV